MRRAVALLAFVVLAAGCSAPTATPSSSPTAGPTATTSTAVVPSEPIAFDVEGVTVRGTLFGAGATGVVLSNMGDNDPADWERFAPYLAGEGYAVLTYAYRYPARPRSLTPEMARGALADLQGAAAYLRSRGATRIVLIGASLGGMVTAKAAKATRAEAVAIIASPADRPDFDLSVAPADLRAITGPKLFIASDDDPTVPAAETRGLYDRAPEPKTWMSFASTAHGTRLLDTEHAEDFRRAIIDFVTGLT
jgi:pimeloyl-ACP methyl ester carboxylesterase